MILALLLACQEPAPGKSDDSAAPDSADSGQDCPAGSHLDGGSCLATLEGWTEGPSLQYARDHHLTFVKDAGDHAFVVAMAGTNARGRVNAKVERARLDGDGTLSDFEELDDWDGAEIGQGLGWGDPDAVLVGGLDSSSNSVGDTWVMSVSDEGEPSFTAGPPLNTTRYHATATVAGGYVYVIGGMEQIVDGADFSQIVLDSVERAPFDGSALGSFELLDPLPDATTHHAAWTWGTGLYIAGGGSGARARDSVLRAEIAEDGSLGEWVQVGTLPEGRATSAATIWLDQVYLVAGMAKLTGDERDTVLRADLNEDGSVGEFEELPNLPMARAHCHQAPLWQGWMVSAGGSISHEDQDEVYVGALE
jgi:hypothetical protein